MSAASEPVAVSRGLRFLSWAPLPAAAGFSLWVRLVAASRDVQDGSRGVVWGVYQPSVLVPAGVSSIVGADHG
jgi:hypothetical protein